MLAILLSEPPWWPISNRGRRCACPTISARSSTAQAEWTYFRGFRTIRPNASTPLRCTPASLYHAPQSIRRRLALISREFGLSSNYVALESWRAVRRSTRSRIRPSRRAHLCAHVAFLPRRAGMFFRRGVTGPAHTGTFPARAGMPVGARSNFSHAHWNRSEARWNHSSARCRRSTTRYRESSARGNLSDARSKHPSAPIFLRKPPRIPHPNPRSRIAHPVSRTLENHHA